MCLSVISLRKLTSCPTHLLCLCEKGTKHILRLGLNLYFVRIRDKEMPTIHAGNVDDFTCIHFGNCVSFALLRIDKRSPGGVPVGTLDWVSGVEVGGLDVACRFEDMPMSHVSVAYFLPCHICQFKRNHVPCHYFFLPPCPMWPKIMLHVDFKKGPCRCVEFKGRGPLYLRVLFDNCDTKPQFDV